jgi:hypothetical protein
MVKGRTQSSNQPLWAHLFIVADRPIDQMAPYKIADLLMIAYGTFKELF